MEPVNRKSIHIGLAALAVTALGLTLGKVGDPFFVIAKGCHGDPISGTVVAVYNDPNGRMLIVRNRHFRSPTSALPGWDFVPIWIGEQSGVLAIWLDKIADARCSTARASGEHEITTAMAL